MGKRIINNKGPYVENQTNTGETYIAGRDIHRHGNQQGLSAQDFQALLKQIAAELKSTRFSKDEQKDIEANVLMALRQAQKEKPQQSLVLSPLNMAMQLLIQAGGAAGAVNTITELLNKAIQAAVHLF